MEKLYKGLTAVVIGGVGRANYETPLRKLGFVKVFRAHDDDKKTIKGMRRFVSKSDLTVILMGCCSHNQRKKAEEICDSVEKHYVRVPGSFGPQRVMNYLIEEYSRIGPKLKK